MLLHKIPRISITAFMAVIMVFTFSGCKKNKVTPNSPFNNTDGGKYYVNAEINGVAWKANEVASGDTANLMIVVGAKIVGNDTTILALVFPPEIGFNNPVDFNASQYKTLLVYGNSNHPSQAEIYITEQTTNVPKGTITLTAINQQAQTVSGTFNAVATNQSGGYVTITNGQFFLPYKLKQGPGLGQNLKF